MIDNLIKEELFKREVSVIVLENIANLEGKKLENEKQKFLFIVFATLILTIWSWKSSTSYVNEKISLRNTPSFPLYNFTLFLNFNYTNEKININFLAYLGFVNGSFTKPKKVEWKYNNKSKYFYSNPLEFLGVDPILLNKGDRLFLQVNCNEKNYPRLNRKYFTFGYKTYIINSKDEIEERLLYKHYFLDEELSLYYKINEGRIYNYKLESNIVKSGKVEKNFSSVSEQENLGFLPPEKYGPYFLSLIFEKGEILKSMEVKEISFWELYYVLYGSTGTLLGIVLYMCCSKNN